MKRAICDANRNILVNPEDRDTVILSLDVSALYPSIDTSLADKSIYDMTLQSNINFEEVNYKEIGKIVRILCDDNEIRHHKLMNFVPTRILDLIGRKQKVHLTYLDHDVLDFKWVWRTSKIPSRRQVRRLIALFLAKTSCWIMDNHTYMFDDKIYRQSSGTPIGLQIAVNISRLVMVDWDQRMTTKLINVNIRMEVFMRYVDDVNLILRVIKHHANQSQSDLEVETLNTVVPLADSIFPGVLKFESDIPSNHTDCKIPILDINCWPANKIIKFEFKKKRCSY